MDVQISMGDGVLSVGACLSFLHSGRRIDYKFSASLPCLTRPVSRKREEGRKGGREKRRDGKKGWNSVFNLCLNPC